MSKRTILVYKSSLLQSIISDVFTFGFLLLCMWTSWGDRFWTFVSGCLFFIVLAGRTMFYTNDNAHRFYSIDDLQEWIDKEKEVE